MQKKKQRKIDETIINRPIVRNVKRGIEPFKCVLMPFYIKKNINTIGVLKNSLKEIYVNKSFYGELKCDKYEKF